VHFAKCQNVLNRLPVIKWST